MAYLKYKGQRFYYKLRPLYEGLKVMNGDVAHFVMIKKISKKDVSIFDPQFGNYSLSLDEFSQVFLNKVLLKDTIGKKPDVLSTDIFKKSEKVQNLLILLVTIPMWINTLLRTYAWISMLSDNGLINTFLKWMGFKPLNLMYTDFAVILGLVTDLLPFMVIPIHTSIRKIDPSLIEASHDLGANKIQTFWKVTFKMSIPGVLNGIMMTFLLSISTFVIPKLLGGGQYMLIGNLIENQFISVGNWNFGSAISIILAFIILVGMTVMKKIDKEEKEEE